MHVHVEVGLQMAIIIHYVLMFYHPRSLHAAGYKMKKKNSVISAASMSSVDPDIEFIYGMEYGKKRLWKS